MRRNITQQMKSAEGTLVDVINSDSSVLRQDDSAVTSKMNLDTFRMKAISFASTASPPKIQEARYAVTS